MNPYYEDDAATIYHGDAMQVAPGLPGADRFRVVTDPPYGVGQELPVVVSAYLRTCLRQMLDRSGTLAMFGYPEALAGFCVYASAVPDEWAVWWPTNKFGGREKRLPRWTEHIAIFGPTPGAEMLKRERVQDGTTLAIAVNRGLEIDVARDGDVWRDPAPGMGFNSHLRVHPNEKPLTLMSRLVQLCSEPGDTVIDPFMGSGTTLRAAKDLGRKAIGIEIEERYCELAARRLSQEVLDLHRAAASGLLGKERE